jgi:hypothetical protein
MGRGTFSGIGLVSDGHRRHCRGIIVCVDGGTFSLVSAKDVTSLSVSSLLISRGGCVII